MLYVLLAVAGLVVWLVLERANELFFVSVRNGRCLVVRGRIPSVLLDGFEDIVRRANVTSASIRAVRSSGHARLVVRGVDDGIAQRMRNVFGTHPIQKLRAARPLSTRNVGQILGFAWLAWLLTGALGGRSHDGIR